MIHGHAAYDGRVRGHWRETAILTGIAALAVAVLAWKGLTTYFFAEAFVYLGSYADAHNSFLGALLRPHGVVFYRPSVWAVNLAWNLLAPPDALLYHLRNFVFVVVNALLLHRLLLRLVPNAFGRAAGVLFYAVSKVHLTTIGYVATFSTLLLLAATLAMFVAFCRWLEQRRRIDYALILFFAVFLIFSKDYGTVAVLLLPFLAWARGEDVRTALRPFVLPLVLAVASYLALRAWVAPPRPQGDYAPRLEVRATRTKIVQAATTLANISLFESEGRTGARGATRWIWRDDLPAGHNAERRLLLLAIGAALFLLWRTRPPVALLMFCVAWGALLFGPTLLTRNQQLYYHNDLVAACAVLFAAAASRERFLTSALLVLLALNAFASQQRMRYSWYDVSERLRPLDAIARQYRASAIRRVVFVTASPPLWEWAIRGDGLAPFVPALFGRHVEVQVTDHAGEIDANTLVIDVDDGMKLLHRGVSGDVELRVGRLFHAAFRLERDRERLDLRRDREVLDHDRRVSRADDVEDARAHRARLIGADDPELVALVGRVRRQRVEEDDRAAALRLEEHFRRGRRRDFLSGERDGARVVRGERGHFGGEFFGAPGEEGVFLAKAIDLRALRGVVLARRTDPDLAPTP
jgi:hypothetical protein